MKSNETLGTNEIELDELLDSYSEECIWSQKVSSTRLLFNSSLQLIIAAVSLYFLRDVFNVTFTLLFIVPYLIAIYLSATMKYSIFANGIKFQWGIMRRSKVFIPFEDITAISLVNYKHEKYSTIHFGTKKKYRLTKISLIDADSRVHITFENIKRGDKVKELLDMLWKRKTKNLKLDELLKVKRKLY